MAPPKFWPSQLTYLTAPSHSKLLSKEQLAGLKSQQTELYNVPPEASQLPCPLVRIIPISSKVHPACGQSGLFAARHLKPGSFILLYLGSVNPGSAPGHCANSTSKGAVSQSDYELWLDRDSAVAVDAERCGNEARFINDYRGAKDRPNAEFREVWSARHKERCMAVFVLPEGKKAKASAGIAKGEEILVSYGKGFWAHRMPGQDATSTEPVPPEIK